MITLLTRGGNRVTVSEECARQMMAEDPAAFVVVGARPERPAEKLFEAAANKMLRAGDNK